MENKRWHFKVPGTGESEEIVIDTKDINSVYDVLKMLRGAEEAASANIPWLPSRKRKKKSARNPKSSKNNRGYECV